ncbi:GPR1/FUN34/YaaH family transporter [Salinisphaera sp.]|uniref:GPR1/FUN34/YaaH family transporter n=1 Tax=Salinisphaera sp. TaxID=1914330 RepID=UPI002D7727F2|nr:GPR1/FUN34/YaaH family transporter [Salinisphaera sp.]HET7315565.1 GPR1/FUN34/YaaH family transporter [Salinisphaera sp.]
MSEKQPSPANANDEAHRVPDRGAAHGQESITRIMIRPLGTPLPLGFVAFGIGTFIFSTFQIGWIPLSESQSLAIIILAFVFPLEFIPGLIAFFTRDTPGATTLTILGASWLVFGLNLLVGVPGQPSAALGIFALTLAFIFIILGGVAIMGKGLIALILAIAMPRYLLVGLYQLTGAAGLQYATGIVGLVLSAVAAYGALALLLEDATQRTVLPLLRRGASRTSLEGDLNQQLGRLRQEAGVRKQL